MALNVQKLAERLKEFEAGQQASQFAKLLWKPKEGQQTIRIVPYKYNPESPFIELKFYYGLGGQTYLAPCTFGKPDPIVELVNTLRASGSEEEKEIASKLTPTPRTYVPILVRGEEEQGVRFWGFGIQVYKQLLKLMTNPKWGDITSFFEGNDLDVEFHKSSSKVNPKTKEAFPETIIVGCPQKTPVVDPTRKDLMEKVKEQVDILTIFPLKTYDELKLAVNKWLNPNAADQPTADTSTPSATAPAVSDPTAAPAATTPAADPAATTQTPNPTGNMAAEFEEFFKKK